MKGYIVTFLCRQDAIIMQEKLYGQKILGRLIGAPSCTQSRCSYVLFIENVQEYVIKNALLVSKRTYEHLYYIENIFGKNSCVKIE